MNYTELRQGDLFKVVGIEAIHKFVKIRQVRASYRQYDELYCVLVINGVEQPGHFTYNIDLGFDQSFKIELCGIDVKLYDALARLVGSLDKWQFTPGEISQYVKAAEYAMGEFEKQYPSYELK